ncbi:hypothetical protein V8F20_012161 [Naviculisporaceae sp. PSN 640]
MPSLLKLLVYGVLGWAQAIWVTEVMCQVLQTHRWEVVMFRLGRWSTSVFSANFLHRGETDAVGFVTEMRTPVDLGE